MTKFGFSAPAAFLAVALWAAPASAATFDFSTLLGGAEGNFNSATATNGEVTATGLAFINGFWIPQNLWVRNVTDDHGIGVCSAGENCVGGGGDHNELSQLTNNEAIRLDKGTWQLWTELWVSSLDSNASAVNPETGRLSWSNSSDPAQNFGANTFQFEYPAFAGTSVEGDIYALAVAAGFDATARYVFFTPGGSLGSNEDYLVWKAAVTGENITPEPASLLLFGMGLLGAGVLRRRAR